MCGTGGRRKELSKVEKRFSVEEANALLPWLRAQLEQLQRLKGEYENKWIQLQRLRRAVAQYGTRETDPFFQQEAELDFLSIQARAILERIHQTGVLVKDIDWGVVDFPAMVNGKPVFLCWRLGEDRVRYYHGLYDGFMGRRPLESEGEDG